MESLLGRASRGSNQITIGETMAPRGMYASCHPLLPTFSNLWDQCNLAQSGMALVLVEGEEKIPGLLNTVNFSVAPMNPQAITSMASAAGRS